MNTIVKLALTGAVKMLVGSDYWEKVKETVAELADTSLTGEEKRAMAFTTLKEGGWRAASLILNLAIEIAVSVLTDKLDKNK